MNSSPFTDHKKGFCLLFLYRKNINLMLKKNSDIPSFQKRISDTIHFQDSYFKTPLFHASPKQSFGQKRQSDRGVSGLPAYLIETKKPILPNSYKSQPLLPFAAVKAWENEEVSTIIIGCQWEHTRRWDVKRQKWPLLRNGG